VTSSPIQIVQADSVPASTAAVKRLHDLADGTLVVYPTPGRGGEGIARDILCALGKRFGVRAPRHPHKLAALAALWMRAERIGDLVVAGADRRPVSEWRLLRDLCRQDSSSPRLTFVVEHALGDPWRAALGTDVTELTLDDLAARIPRCRYPFTLADEVLDEHPDYPPVPDSDFPFFPVACVELLARQDVERAIATFRRGRSATTVWLQIRRRIEERHGPGPRHPHAFLDTLVAPCVTVDAAIARLRGAQAEFLLDGTLLEIDTDAFAVDHARHAGARASRATASILRALLEPHLAAVGALACATRANATQIGSMTMADVQLIGASIASGHRLAPAFVGLLAAQILARRQQDADGQGPLFLTTDGNRAATVRHINNWLARVGRETGLRFDRDAGWNRYTTPAWARFRRLESCELLAIPQRRARW
jgi:hypothetical protein